MRRQATALFYKEHTGCEEAAGWRVAVTPPFSLEKTVRAFQRLPANETQVWREGAFIRRLRFASAAGVQPGSAGATVAGLPPGAAVLRVRQPGPEELEVTTWPGAGTEEARREVTARVRWMLALDCDLGPFAQRVERFPRLRAVFEQIAGLKPPRFPDLFETFVNTVLFQQISLHAGTALLNRLARRFGETFDTPRGPVRRLPSAEEMTEIPEEALAEIGFSRGKARCLIALAHRIAAGELVHQDLAALPTPELEHRLVALPGIGPWSARVIMLRGFGRLDTFPTGDSGAANALRTLFDVPATDAPALQAALLEALAPYQGYLYFCLLGYRLLRAGVL